MRVGSILWGRRAPHRGGGPRGGGGAPPWGGPAAKTSRSIQKVFDCKWYKAACYPLWSPELPTPQGVLPEALRAIRRIFFFFAHGS
jgi:hypothetical protein